MLSRTFHIYFYLYFHLSMPKDLNRERLSISCILGQTIWCHLTVSAKHSQLRYDSWLWLFPDALIVSEMFLSDHHSEKFTRRWTQKALDELSCQIILIALNSPLIRAMVQLLQGSSKIQPIWLNNNTEVQFHMIFWDLIPFLIYKNYTLFREVLHDLYLHLTTDTVWEKTPMH